jgi:hypothetical protein
MRKKIKIASFFIVVLVLVVVSPVLAKLSETNPALRSASVEGSIVLVGVQQADGSINIVYLNPDNVRPSRAGVWGEMVSMLPDAMTIALLGLAGLFYRRRPAYAFVKR